MNEKISALVDHQPHPEQRQDLFDRILADDAAGKVWQRYHLIGGVLRGEVQQTGADLSPRIRDRLEREPTVLAPAPGDPEAMPSSAPPPPPARADAWKSAGMLALAASLALVAVTMLKPEQEQGQGERAAASIAGNPVDGDSGRARLAQEFGEMLAQHGEFSASPGLNGLIGYAKQVSNESIER